MGDIPACGEKKMQNDVVVQLLNVHPYPMNAVKKVKENDVARIIVRKNRNLIKK